MADGCSPVIPASVPITTHGHDRGFTPSDAALVHAGQTSGESRSNLIETSASAKDNLVQTLEAKFQLERSSKNTELAIERAARVSDANLNAVRAEVMGAIKDENNRTRELLMSQASDGLKSELADSKANVTQAALLAAIKTLLGK